MTRQDTIRVAGTQLHARFASAIDPAGISVLNLADGLVLRRKECSIVVGHAGTTHVLETFANERQADDALDAVHRALHRHMRRESLLRWLRGAMKYVALPFGLILLGMALNAEVKPSGPLPSPAVTAPLAPPPMPTAPPVATSGPEISPTAIASALQKGAESGKYAVRLGKAKSGIPLYVFEDPLCSHCQEFAPTLDALAKQRPVYIFPVSVIGGAASKSLAAKVICEPSTGRESKWNQALHGVLGASGADTSGCGEAGVTANDEIFAMMGLRYTPTVFDATGRMLPPNQDMSAVGIDRWLTKD